MHSRQWAGPAGARDGGAHGGWSLVGPGGQEVVWSEALRPSGSRAGPPQAMPDRLRGYVQVSPEAVAAEWANRGGAGDGRAMYYH